MRELLAWTVCVMAFCLVTSLSYFFAVRHNPAGMDNPRAPAPRSEQGSKPEAAPPSGSDSGRQIFEAQNCSSCHSIAGVGNPRSQLDDVGARLTPAELRGWITGTGTASDSLPIGVRKRKARYSQLTEAEMKALIEYLSLLKSESPQ